MPRSPVRDHCGVPPNPVARLRTAARRLVRALLGAAGYRLVRAHAPAEHHSAPEGSGVVTIPAGRTVPFAAGGYDVVPEGRYDIVVRDYYSPVPDLTLLGGEVWTRRSPLGGLDLATDAAIDRVERELAPLIAELDLPVQDPGRPGTFFLHNGGFGPVDAELLYGMIRAGRPRRVVELGSGYSTLLIALATAQNADDGTATTHEVFDPFPRPHILGDALAASKLTALSATDVPLEVFATLESGDILFVDTTHTVKLGGDVNHLILDVLPILRPGVIVHFHDIFLPWEYPRPWFEEMHWYWAEQYLLQAFLAYNHDFEVILPAHALARDHPERLAASIPAFTAEVAPGSMWIRRVGPPVDARPQA
jgi:predicted O-methyltransferase YrrM